MKAAKEQTAQLDAQIAQLTAQVESLAAEAAKVSHDSAREAIEKQSQPRMHFQFEEHRLEPPVGVELRISPPTVLPAEAPPAVAPTPQFVPPQPGPWRVNDPHGAPDAPSRQPSPAPNPYIPRVNLEQPSILNLPPAQPSNVRPDAPTNGPVATRSAGETPNHAVESRPMPHDPLTPTLAEPQQPEPPPAAPVLTHERQAANREELDALGEHVKIAEDHFKQADARHKAGKPGGTTKDRELAAFELARAQGELALAEGLAGPARERFDAARSHAEEALKAVTAAHEAGNVPQDVVLQTARHVASIKQKLAQLSDRSPIHVQQPSADPDVLKQNLRYDGKTFNQWRNQWLSGGPDPQRMLEALTALEAFAAAGYGDEVASAVVYGAFQSTPVAQQTREYLSKLTPSDAQSIVNVLREVLETELSAKRRIAAIRALAAIGLPAEPALDILKKTLKSDDPQLRIAAATAIKMIVGKDHYQKPIADVLGEQLGITVVQTESGAWAALPRDDASDADAFNEFNEAVIKEQESLFPPDSKESAQ